MAREVGAQVDVKCVFSSRVSSLRASVIGAAEMEPGVVEDDDGVGEWSSQDFVGALSRPLARTTN